MQMSLVRQPNATRPQSLLLIQYILKSHRTIVLIIAIRSEFFDDRRFVAGIYGFPRPFALNDRFVHQASEQCRFPRGNLDATRELYEFHWNLTIRFQLIVVYYAQLIQSSLTEERGEPRDKDRT